jgi:SWIM zinc finger
VSGNLVATMFATLAAEMADPDRFRRGRAYARDDAVALVEIAPGMARGEVMGSRYEPYEVTIATRAVRRAVAAGAMVGEGRPSMLVPRPDDLTIECTCPDWGDPCKHAVAVLIALGDEMSRDTGLLERWRRVSDPLPDRPNDPEVSAPRALRVAPDPLDPFFGRGYDPDPIEPLPPLHRRQRVLDGNDPVAELVGTCVDSAIAALARIFDDR